MKKNASNPRIVPHHARPIDEAEDANVRRDRDAVVGGGSTQPPRLRTRRRGRR